MNHLDCSVSCSAVDTVYVICCAHMGCLLMHMRICKLLQSRQTLAMLMYTGIDTSEVGFIGGN